MDLGLYNLKYPARKLIAGVLPLVRHVNPNAVSWALLPVGAATAAAYALGAQGAPGWYLAGVALVVLRMFLGTLDGLMAVEFGKQTPRGELVNRIAPELCDAMYLATLAVARPEWQLPGIGALALAWVTSFSGLLGAVIGKPTQSVGPVGQTDRLAALQLCSVWAFFSDRAGGSVDALGIFLWWCVIGGALTVVLRLRRHLRAAAAAPGGG